MQTILVAGAGKSSIYLIEHLITNAPKNKWKIIVADGSKEAIAEKIHKSPYAESAVIDITSTSDREPLVKRADIVVSLMPPHLHIHLAKDCLKHKKHIITSSYISDEMKEMDAAAKKADLMFMCEMGLDPGIDHMTANQIIHSIQKVASSITAFRSYCGGLIAPDSDNNPWHYKFSWNPRNIITAGTGGAHYLLNNKEVFVPYESIFENCKKVKIDDLGFLAYYANRDSSRYLSLYDVPEIKTFLRATLRHPHFCKGWNALIKMGLTLPDDKLNISGNSYADWIKSKTGYTDTNTSLQEHVARFLEIEKDDKIISMLDWLGIFSTKAIHRKEQSSADILLDILLDKWQMAPYDKDMVVMHHEVEYIHKNKKIQVSSSMVLEGESRDHSAMAKTVGMPMAILAKFALTKKITLPTGVLIPNMPSVYRPILTELRHHGIEFNEKVE
ncbi:MAG: saccharopine dehydrogenase NADP-binding domain-containing protein [Bacteroidetes bacterium]|nr:saccharopine dehydrogenase NADP-binding domain-containing protein [Bacteroidota bacterium]